MQEQHKKQPEISIIVPVYKTERFLSACISSILAQTFTDFELILVDDGSPDSCPALCDAAAAKDSRIRVIHQKNCGLSGARNAGLDAAEGEWIAFVDSDDTITPDFCAKLYHAAQEAGAQMAVCNYRQVDEALTPIREQYLHVRREVLTPEQALEHSTLLPYMVVWNKLYHRSIFAQLRFAEGKLNEDTLLIAYAYEKADRIANIPDALYLYRKVAGSIVNSKVTLRNLDRVEANYTVFECVRRHGINGLVITYGRVAPFIATLATMTIYRGATLVFTDGNPISGLTQDPLFHGFGQGDIAGLPVPAITMFLAFIILWFVLSRTSLGRKTYAVGGSEKVSYIAGIKIDRVKIFVYALTGMLCGIAGAIITSRLNSAQPTAGAGYELDAIAAVVLGGTSLAGGRGHIVGTLIGALIIGTLNNGLNILDVSSFYQQVVKGIVILLAVLADRKKA